MKKVFAAAVFMIGLSSTAFLAAQRGTSPAGTGTIRPVQPGEVGRGQLDMMTVTGCLQRSETNAAASPSTPAATTATQATRTGGSFILTNARPSAVAAATTGSTPGGSAPAPGSTAARGSGTTTGGGAVDSAAAARNYTLIEKNTGELGPHLGHMMQITGVIASPAAGSSGDGANASATGSPNSATGGVAGRMGSMMANPRLEVFSIRMIAAACPATPSTAR